MIIINTERVDRITEIIETSNDANELTLKLKRDYPQVNLELEVVDAYLERATSIQSESILVEYTEEFTQIVEQSEVSDDSKQTINSSLSVYANKCLFMVNL